MVERRPEAFTGAVSFRPPDHQQLADMLNRRGIQAIADFLVHRHARFALVAEHADLDELMGVEVDFDFGQHGFGQPFSADENDGLERVGLRAQVGTLGGREFDGGHEK